MYWHTNSKVIVKTNLMKYYLIYADLSRMLQIIFNTFLKSASHLAYDYTQTGAAHFLFVHDLQLHLLKKSYQR